MTTSSARTASTFRHPAANATPTNAIATVIATSAKRAARLTARNMRRSGLSALGWSTIAVSLACVATGIPLGWRELIAAGFAGLSMVVCAIIMGLRKPEFAATLSVQSTRVTVGGTIDIATRITSERQHLRSAATHCLLRFGNESYRLAVHANASNGPADRKLTIPASRRGVISVGPLTALTGDPMGLVRRSIELASAIDVHVHPRILPLSPLPTGATHDIEGRASNKRASSDVELYDVRDYMPGDDLRHIHWSSTAKTGSLMVRQYQATQRTAIILLLDRNGRNYASPEEFELAVTMYASIGVQALREYRQLITAMGAARVQPHTVNALLDHCSALQPVTGERGTMPMFNELAEDRPEAAEPAVDGSAAKSRYLQDGTTSLHVAIVGSQLPLETIHRFARALPTGLVIILRIAIGESSGTVRADGCLLATAGAEQDLPMILEALR